MGWKQYVIALALAAAIVYPASGEPRAGEPPRDSDGQSEMRVKKPNGDEPKRKFVRGPSLTPSNKLAAWFERQAGNNKKAYFRVPLILKQGQVGFSLRGARIGIAPGALEVYVTDAALGIGLAHRAVTHCQGRKICAMWVEGHLARDTDEVLRFDVMKFVAPIEADALASAHYVEIEEDHIPEAAEPDQGFPIPKGVRKNDTLGGATSLAPGRNYTIKVYDIDFDTETITAFYERHLPEATRASERQEVTFSTPRGSVKLAPLPKGTRITLAIGPQ